MNDNSEINIAYQQLANRTYRFEHLSIVGAPESMLEDVEQLIKKARALLDLLGAYDPIKVKKYIELAIICDYAADTKVASCFSCETALKVIAEDGRFCHRIENSDPSDPGIDLEIPFPNNADRNCDQYVRIDLAKDTDAQLLPEILSVMQQKYGVDKDFILRNI